MFSTNVLRKGLFPMSDLWLRSHRDKPWEQGFSRDLWDTFKDDSSISMGLLGELQASSAPCKAIRLLVFKAEERSNTVKLAVPRFSCFSGINTLWIIACKPLVNFQNSQKVDFLLSLPGFSLLLGRSRFLQIVTPLL